MANIHTECWRLIEEAAMARDVDEYKVWVIVDGKEHSYVRAELQEINYEFQANYHDKELAYTTNEGILKCAKCNETLSDWEHEVKHLSKHHGIRIKPVADNFAVARNQK